MTNKHVQKMILASMGFRRYCGTYARGTAKEYRKHDIRVTARGVIL